MDSGRPVVTPARPRGPRPPDITLSVQLWVFVIVMSVISRVAEASLARGSDALREQYETMRDGDGFSARVIRTSYPDFASFDATMFGTALFMTAVGVVVAAVLTYLLWRGRGWSRLVLQFVGAFVVVQGVFSFFSHNALVAVPAILGAIAVFGALITANSRGSSEFVAPGSTS